jgi:hypothetical protein
MLSTLAKKSASRGSTALPRVISRGFAKEIKFGVEGRAAMLKGVDTLADAVQVSQDFFSVAFSLYRVISVLVLCDGISSWIFAERESDDNDGSFRFPLELTHNILVPFLLLRSLFRSVSFVRELLGVCSS